MSSSPCPHARIRAHAHRSGQAAQSLRLCKPLVFRRSSPCPHRCRFTSTRAAGRPDKPSVATVELDNTSLRDGLADQDLEDALPTAAVQETPTTSGRGKLVASVVTTIGLLALIVGGIYFQDAIKDFLIYFSGVVDDMGPLGVVIYSLVYIGLEVLALPAIPLTMTAGAIFGIVPGSLLVSVAGTIAATLSFLIARYVARDKFLPWARKNKQFRAVDMVISQDGLKVVTLLRLSPLLPLAASNYLYGLTSVSLPAYCLGSWLGMLPGTVAYVSAGHVGKVAFMDGGDMPLEWWQIGLAFAVSLGVIGYIGTQAKKALSQLDEAEEGALGTVDQS